MAQFMVLGAPMAPLTVTPVEEEEELVVAVLEVAERGSGKNGQDCFLPRSLPFVGFMRHAPQQVLFKQLDRLLRRRLDQAACGEEEEEKEVVDVPLTRAPPRGKSGSEPALPRKSPYVGFQRHSPPSPKLRFAGRPVSPQLPLKLPLKQLDLGEDEELNCDFELEPADQRLPCGLPEEAWALVVADMINVAAVGTLSAVAQGFAEVVRSPLVWQKQVVRIRPGSVRALAPQLPVWLPAWRDAAKLVVPRSTQLAAELRRRAPELPVEVAWRFDTHLQGAGVEVLRDGSAVRRVAEEELVVLGDAALASRPGQAPYLEVCLDERGEGIGDNLNDFGLGVTACNPQDIDVEELGAVADEVPRSWVVDFTMNSVVLSVNNKESAKGFNFSANDLCKDDRVGLKLVEDAVEVYINGALRQRLVPPAEDCVPQGVGLFPVLDLYGRTVQVSRTDAEAPLP